MGMIVFTDDFDLPKAHPVKFQRTTLQDAMLINVDRFEDERGHFARTFCREEFAEQGLETEYVQANHSGNIARGTLRGLHMQREPHGEVKLVRCVKGAIWDVIVDMRPGSQTYRSWEGFELSEENSRLLYVPAGFAHGFLTLADNTDVIYQVSHAYTPQAEVGVRYNDPVLGIDWPDEARVVSAKDASWPLLPT